LLKAPLASLMTWMVIGIALALPSGLYVALANVHAVSQGWDGAAQISLFLRTEINEARGRELAAGLALRPDIHSVRYISRQEALQEFQALSGFGEVLDNLDKNPLPAVIVVRPEQSHISASMSGELRKDLQGLVEVELAQLDLEWVQRLYTMMQIGQRMTTALALLLSLGVLLIIGNTIRLAIENRRDEILVVKLVGGTDQFVRRPFLYMGFWYGLGGGFVAWIIILISLFWLSAPVARLADLYQSQFSLMGLGFVDTLGLWMTGAILGLLGAWMAVARHLDAIEPR
jgi:cell division transport system permease protein